MRIERIIPRSEGLSEFMERNNLTLTVQELPRGDRWHVCVKGSEIKRGPVLESAYGAGVSAHDAAQSMIERIRGQLLVIDAMKPTRVEILVPHRLVLDFKAALCLS